jgi:glycosyltransferase involved in cell wall biosynthesis
MEAASNIALSNLEGDFVVVHDDDDSWHPEFLLNSTKFLQNPLNSRYAAVVTNCILIHECVENERVVEVSREKWSFWRPHINMAEVLNRNFSPPICLLIRKSVCDAIGPFNQSLPVLGDWDYNIRIMTLGDIGTIDQFLAHYHHRIQPDADLYGNSVRAGEDKHRLYDTLYRNSLVRSLIQREPGYIGLLHILLRQAADHQAELTQQMNRENGWAHDRHADLRYLAVDVRRDLERLERSVERIEALVTVALRPARAIWRRLLPVRRLVAKLRGRI